MVTWKKWALMGTVLALAMSQGAVSAETQIEVGGQVRYRGNVDARDFDKDSDPGYFSEMRTRVNVKAVPQDNLILFIQIQDSRIAGSNSGGLSNDTNLGLHQGYFRWGMGKEWFFQAGRFTMSFGDQRLVGAVEWHNVGRSWDGARLFAENERWRLDLFAVKLTESFSPSPDHDEDNDRNFHGLTFKLKDMKLDGFVYYDRDAAADPSNTHPEDPNLSEVKKRFNRFTMGAYTARSFAESWDYIFNGAFQVGRDKRWFSDDPSNPQLERQLFKTIAAWMLAFEGGYTFSGAHKHHLAILVDYASGDDDPSNDSIKSFNNLYYTGHKFRGYMDYFLSSNVNGLLDLALRYRAKITTKWLVKADLHHFRSAVNIASGDDTAHHIGDEVNITLKYQQDHFSVEGLLAAFSKRANAANYDGNIFQGSDASGWWAYAWFTATFEASMNLGRRGWAGAPGQPGHGTAASVAPQGLSDLADRADIMSKLPPSFLEKACDNCVT